VALAPPTLRYAPLHPIAGKIRNVPVNSDTVRTAHGLEICCGD